jgi:hypothetical protein
MGVKMDNSLKKEIIKILEAEGLDKAEEMAVIALSTTFKLMRLIIPKVSGYAAIMVLPLLDVVEPKIMGEIDQIDGVDNPDY